jgi:hypothetical protein
MTRPTRDRDTENEQEKNKSLLDPDVKFVKINLEVLFRLGNRETKVYCI